MYEEKDILYLFLYTTHPYFLGIRTYILYVYSLTQKNTPGLLPFDSVLSGISKSTWAQRLMNLEIPEARFLNILGTS